MSSLGSPSTLFLAKKGAYEIKRSLRFNDDDNAYLNRTPSSTGNRTTFTLSLWIKRASNLDEFQRIFEAGADTNNRTYFTFDGDDKLEINHRDGGSEAVNLTTTARFRDVSAWYHIVLAIDTTQSTSSNRIKIYVNETQQTAFDTSTYPNSSKEFDINSTAVHYIGRTTNNTSNFDGYMAEINFIDGFQYDPSYFGQTDAITGQWNPKKYTGSYGSNGFYLNFSTNTLGTDRSGNGNDFTPNNFSVVAGAGNDVLEDTPINNFATINGSFRVDGFNGTRTLSQGNLAISGSTNDSSGDFMQAASIPFPLTGKWYVEANVTTLGTSGGNDGGPLIGIMDIPYIHSDPKAKVVRADGKVATTGNAGGAGNSQFTSSFAGSVSQGDVWQLAYDADNRYVYFGKNNSWANGSGSYNQSDFSNAQAYATQPTAGVQQVYIFTQPYSTNSMSFQLDFNFGQRAFAHTPPTGYEKLNTTNLPDPTIKLPNKHFDTLLYSGNGSDNRDITGLNFAPDWVWLKRRDGSMSHNLGDTVRGANKVLFSDQTAAENTETDRIKAYNSDGFRLGTDSAVNFNGYTYVTWNWNAGDTDGKTYTVTVVSDSGNKYRFDGYGTSAVTLDLAEGGTYIFNYPSAHPFRFSTTSDGTHGGGSEYTTGVTVISSTSIQIVVAASAPTLYYYCSSHSGMGGAINTNSTLGSSNFDGTIQTKVKVNALAGFSIINYTGNGTAGSTVGHGLGVKPDFMILRNRPDVTNWIVYHSELNTDGQSFLELNETQDGLSTSTTLYNSTAPSSSVITLGTNNASNGNNDAMLVYAFSEVAGYSRIGSYLGNGSSNGTFVFCGFRPAWVLIKKSSAAGSWVLWDNKRNPHNTCDIDVNPNRDFAEDNYSNHDVDFLSNGFKFTSSDNTTNHNAYKYVFIAFAESPFKNARAR